MITTQTPLTIGAGASNFFLFIFSSKKLVNITKKKKKMGTEPELATMLQEVAFLDHYTILAPILELLIFLFISNLKKLINATELR